MRVDRQNVLVLSACQMLFGACRSLLTATAPLVAYAIVDEKALATLPTSLVIVGTALATIPAAMMMRRLGRRIGFLAGAAIGAASGGICLVGTLLGDFWVFAAGAFLFGLCSGIAQLYRFAATDLAEPDYRGKAISLVLAGGVIAAFLGPELAKEGEHLTEIPFAGGYALLTIVSLLTLIVLLFLKIPKPTRGRTDGPRRPLGVIMAQPTFVVSTLVATIAQGVMTLLMTATPIAMQHVHHPFADTAFVIEWHIFAMFAPGFFTGLLITRYGEIFITQAGIVLQLFAVAVALTGDGVTEFWLSLLLLGLGWNFTFTAATTLIVHAYTPAERDATQGATNFIIYAFVAALSLSSGALVHYLGWIWVNIGALPLIVLSGAATFWYSARYGGKRLAETSAQ